MKSLLESISQPQEIQNLNLQELTQLAKECRQRIIEVTSQRGGHLASSLGTVEITVALLKNFDFRFDRFDLLTIYKLVIFPCITQRY